MTQTISPIVYRRAKELVKVIVDKQTLESEEELMEELCANMDSFAKEN